MRFASLGSGSGGNAFLVEQGRTCVMIDCGFSLKETERRLHRLGKTPADLSGVLVTHEHADHIHGVGMLSRKYGLTVWMTPGTWRAQRAGELAGVHLFNCHEPLEIDDLCVQPFPVPHDALEPSQFVFSDGDVKLAIATDLGSHTPHIVAQLSGCEALVLECNHDTVLLASGSYPASLKLRVGGRHGHLSNDQSAELVARLDQSRLQHVVAAHLSEKHNTPALAAAALSEALVCAPDWIGIADQATGLDWRSIERIF